MELNRLKHDRMTHRKNVRAAGRWYGMRYGGLRGSNRTDGDHETGNNNMVDMWDFQLSA